MSKLLLLLTLLFGVLQLSNAQDNSSHLLNNPLHIPLINSGIKLSILHNNEGFEARWNVKAPVIEQIISSIKLPKDKLNVTEIIARQTVFFVQNLNELKYSHESLTEVPQDLINLFPGLQRLHLVNCENLTRIGSTSFNKLNDHFEQLTFNESAIGDVEPGTFAKFKKLRRLSLNDNKIKQLQSDTFKGLDNLYFLSLDGNGLVSLVKGVFNGLAELRILKIQSNQLTNHGLHDEAFAGLNLSTLALSYNNLTTIPTKSLRHLKSLKFLYLRGNHIETIPSNAFEGLGNLEYLGLEHSRIKNIEPYAFYGLTFDNKPLPLNDCSIENLQADAFNGLVIKDAHLNLLHNKITRIDNGAFRNMTARSVVIDPQVDTSNIASWGGNVTSFQVCPDQPAPCYNVNNSG
uniref:LRRCT domain-containing protein n=1 Tax=Bracon brevicornis TaxID=1563983 RepID=A0A6V7I245_9HYME